MAFNKKGIIEAKFKRDGKQLLKTFLISSITVDKKDLLNCINIVNQSNEESIVLYFESSIDWFLITDKSVIDCRDKDITRISFNDIDRVNPISDIDSLIKRKEEGLIFIPLLLKDGSIYNLRIEVLSFSLIDGIITYLMNS